MKALREQFFEVAGNPDTSKEEFDKLEEAIAQADGDAQKVLRARTTHGDAARAAMTAVGRRPCRASV